jgi:RNA polymerase sigma-70 factor (ECF subfamily)
MGPIMDDVSNIEAVRKGDIAAFASLYAAHVGAVQTVVRSHVHDKSLAEDVVQDVFMRALESLPKLEDPARFRAWLMGIARHTAIDARRGIARLPESRDDAGSDRVGGVEPDHIAELAELSALVWGAVAGLSPRDATAMALVSLGFGIGDVALALGVSHGAAKVAVHRARERARQALMVEVLVRRQAPVCAAVDPEGDVVALAHHLRTCQECQAAARLSL